MMKTKLHTVINTSKFPNIKSKKNKKNIKPRLIYPKINSFSIINNPINNSYNYKIYF